MSPLDTITSEESAKCDEFIEYEVCNNQKA